MESDSVRVGPIAAPAVTVDFAASDMAGSSAVSAHECSRLEEKEIRTPEVKEGVTTPAEGGGVHTHPTVVKI